MAGFIKFIYLGSMCILLACLCSLNSIVKVTAQPNIPYYTPSSVLAGSNNIQQNASRTFHQSDPTLSFTKYLNGVKYAAINLNKKDQQLVDTLTNGSAILNTVKAYLQNLGIEEVAITTIEKQELYHSVNSVCDIVKVRYNSALDIKTSKLYNHELEFTTCQNSTFTLTASDEISNNGQILQGLYDLLHQLHGIPIQYNKHNRLIVQSHLKDVGYTDWNLKLAQSHFKQGNYIADNIEGIYQQYFSSKDIHFGKPTLKVMILKNKNNTYSLIYLEGATNQADWKIGELMGDLLPTALSDVYDLRSHLPNKDWCDDCIVHLPEKGKIELRYGHYLYPNLSLYKTHPRPVVSSVKPISTGSSVAISADGFVVTNYHVVNGGNSFKLRDGNGNIYNAKLVKSVEKEDLAILKINDFNFTSLDTLPYTISNQNIRQGQKVFTLGFPRPVILGNAAKLNDGTISALTGFGDDIGSYQISLPIHPGNSGGGLFDLQNNRLIGIINAFMSEMQNTSYAIKVSRLIELLSVQQLIKTGPFYTTSPMKGKSLPDQVDMLKPYVFKVEVYQ